MRVHLLHSGRDQSNPDVVCDAETGNVYVVHTVTNSLDAYKGWVRIGEANFEDIVYLEQRGIPSKQFEQDILKLSPEKQKRVISAKENFYSAKLTTPEAKAPIKTTSVPKP